jgi:hypothetical protein
MSYFVDRHADMLRDGDHAMTMAQRFEVAEALEAMFIELMARREAMARIGSLMRSAAGTPLVRVLPAHVQTLIEQVHA